MSVANPAGTVSVPAIGYDWRTSVNGTTWTDIPAGAGANQQNGASHVLSYATTAAARVLVQLVASYVDNGGSAETATSPTWNLVVRTGAGNATVGADKSDGHGGTYVDVLFGMNGNDAISAGAGMTSYSEAPAMTR